ncbi:hypothetical protein E4U43_004937, partial [Claviceps pusilla]
IQYQYSQKPETKSIPPQVEAEAEAEANWASVHVHVHLSEGCRAASKLNAIIDAI